MIVVGRLFLPRAHLISSLSVIAVVVIALATLDGTAALARSSEDSYDAAAERRRGLHPLGFYHTHFQRPIQTQTPTTMTTSITSQVTTQSPTQSPTALSLFDDEYYTDDGAINEEMMRGRKELYKQERDDDSDDSDENSNPPNRTQAFESVEDVPSSTSGADNRRRVNLLLTSGISTILAWSLFFW